VRWEVQRVPEEGAGAVELHAEGGEEVVGGGQIAELEETEGRTATVGRRMLGTNR